MYIRTHVFATCLLWLLFVGFARTFRITSHPSRGSQSFLDEGGIDIQQFPGDVGNDTEPCYLPTVVRRAPHLLQGHTPYGGDGRFQEEFRNAYMWSLTREEVEKQMPIHALWTYANTRALPDAPMSQDYTGTACKLMGVYLVSRHCTRLPTSSQMSKLLEAFDAVQSNSAVRLDDDVVQSLTQLKHKHETWRKKTVIEKARSMAAATSDICTKCGLREQMLMGKRFAHFLREASEASEANRFSVKRSATVVARTQQSSDAFFMGLAEKLPRCLGQQRRPCMKGDEVEVSKLNGVPSEQASFLKSRAHTICRSFKAWSRIFMKIRKGFIHISAKTKSTLKAMFAQGAEPPDEDPIWVRVAEIAMYQCEDHVARGSPRGELPWCDFLGTAYVSNFGQAGSEKNSMKQGPSGTHQAWSHLALLLEDFVDFGLEVFGSNSSVTPVRILHGHAETILPVLTLMGLVDTQFFSPLVFKNDYHVPFSANFRMEFYKCGAFSRVRTVLNEKSYGNTLMKVKHFEDFKKEIWERLTDVNFTEEGPLGGPFLLSPSQKISALKKVCGGFVKAV